MGGSPRLLLPIKRRAAYARDDSGGRCIVCACDSTPQEERNTAILCAERVYFQCHRMLVSDYLTAHGHTAVHIDDDRRPLREHKLMAEARLVDGRLIYDALRLF